MPTTTEKKDGGVAESPKPASRAWLWSSLTIAGALVILSISLLAYVMNVYKSIYPNVYADDIKLGGMSAAQANQAVAQHILDKLSGFSVTAESAGASHTFTVENINAEYDAGITAQNAYAVGREGGFFKRVGDIFKAYFSRVDVEVTPKLNAGREAVAEQIAVLAERVDTPVRQYSYVINEENIVISCASDGLKLNQSSAADEIMSRFERLESGGAVLEPEIIKPEPLDIDNLRKLIYKEPKDAFLEASDEVKIMPHQTGVDFDVNALRRELDSGKPEIVVPLIFTEPDITQQILQDSLFRDQLSTFTTYLTASNIPRTSNIKIASGHINGKIVLSGETFSFNETVGRRTAERGFQEAGAYLNGKLVPEIGGGICQMSTTTYNAALLANLKIVERNSHSMTVGYVPLGQDAMVSWGLSDLKFENTSEYPIQIMAVQSGNYVKVTILGTKTDDLKVEMERKTLSSTPMQRIEQVNAGLAPGKENLIQEGHNGYVVDTYRVVKDGAGNVVSRNFEAKSRYKKVDTIVEIGPAATDPAATPTSLE